MRRISAALTLLLLVVLVPVAQAQDQRCFSETNQCISGPIRTYWERNGGLPVFGFPITAQAVEQVEGVPLQAQWFERDRLEIQPSGLVTAGRLGVERLEQLGTPWTQGVITGSVPGCVDSPETGHQACLPAFAQYWRAHGGLARFGHPVTDEFEATVEGHTYVVQYFERRRFELHPEIGPDAVLLGLLGREVYDARQAAPPTPTALPAPQPPVTAPAPSGTCAQNAPAPAEGAQAWVTVPTPGRRSDETLCARLIANGQVVAGAQVSATAHYKSTDTALGPAQTGADGVAQITFSTGGASSGFMVKVDVTVTSGGQTFTAQTSFTPTY